ncbi:N-6 DNA methylase [Pedobacter sp. P351]|uniref:N-6 DNA methylase n=1 Tax=Pedobacter superstes TaxID=3133441 RepID=UPI0030ADCDC9
MKSTHSRDWLQSISYIDSDNRFPVHIFTDISNLLERLDLEKLRDVILNLEAIDTSLLSTEEFGAAFEYILELNLSDNFKSELVRTPHQVSELMVGILNPKGGSLYDPVCGTAGLLTKAFKVSRESLYIKGTEINYRTTQLAFMNLVMNGAFHVEIKTEDCFNELKSDNSYDYIIGDLPLLSAPNPDIQLELNSRWDIQLPKSGRGLSSLVLFILSKLNSKGKAVFTVSDSFLDSGGSEQKVRNLLLREDFIETVISLPSGSLKPYTNGKASIIVLSKRKPSYLIGHVKFINVENTGTSNRNIKFNTKQVIDSYKEKYIDDNTVQIVSTADILIRDTLQVKFYIETFKEVNNLLNENKAVLLSDLVHIQAGNTINNRGDIGYSEGIPYIKIENLEKDILDMYLSSNRFENYVRSPNYQRLVFRSEMLLVARLGDNLKPTYFKPSSKIPEIITHTGVFSLVPTGQHSLNLEYLYYQLYSPVVVSQIEQKRSGAAMPFISIKALKQIVIPYMPLISQNEFIATQKANIIASEKAKVNQRLKAIGFEEQEIQLESDIVRTLVHELRPKLLNISTLSGKIKRIINKNSLEKVTEYDEETFVENIDIDLVNEIEPTENYNLLDVCTKLLDDSKQLSDMLSTVKDVMSFNLKPTDFIEVDVFQLFEEYLNSKRLEIRSRFSIELKGAHVSAFIHDKSFKTIIDQLLINAEKHAFKKGSNVNKVQFTISEDRSRDLLVIEYSNNGEAFPLSEQSYIAPFTKSKNSSGSGIGGNYIFRIVKAHGGNLAIKENVKKGFFLTIEIPKNLNQYE